MTEPKLSVKECNHGFSLQERAVIPRNRSIGYQSWSKASAGKRWNTFPRNEALDNAALWLIAFMNKGLCSADSVEQHRRRSSRHTPWHRKIPSLNDKHYLFIVDYHIRFPIKKQVEGFNTDNLIKIVQLFFQNTGCPRKPFRHRHKFSIGSNSAYI